MSLRNCYLQMDFEKTQDIDTNNEISGDIFFELEFDYIKQFRDVDGICHIKTIFDHNELDENDLWEVFDTSNGSSPLELLIDVDI